MVYELSDIEIKLINSVVSFPGVNLGEIEFIKNHKTNINSISIRKSDDSCIDEFAIFYSGDAKSGPVEIQGSRYRNSIALDYKQYLIKVIPSIEQRIKETYL